MHLYDDDGTYTATLTVTDAKGHTDTEEHQVKVRNEEPEADVSDATGTPELVTVRYRMLDPGKTDKAQLRWSLTSSKPGWPAQSGTKYGAIYDTNITQVQPGTYPVTLTVTDKDGAEARDDAVVTIVDTKPEDDIKKTRWYATCDPNVKLDGEERDLLDLVNEYRESNGLPPVTVSATLTRAAERHAGDMAAKDYMAHQGSDGSDPGKRAWDAGYPKSAGVGENLAETETAYDSLWGWRASASGHNENMLNPGWRAIGIARAKNTGGSGKWRTATSYGTALDCPATDNARLPDPPAARLARTDTTPSGAAALVRGGDALVADAAASADRGAKLVPTDEDVSDAPARLRGQSPESQAAPAYPPAVAVTLSAHTPRANHDVTVTNRSRTAAGTPGRRHVRLRGRSPTRWSWPPTRAPPTASPTTTAGATTTCRARLDGNALWQRVSVAPIRAPYLHLEDTGVAIAGKPYAIRYRAEDVDTGDAGRRPAADDHARHPVQDRHDGRRRLRGGRHRPCRPSRATRPSTSSFAGSDEYRAAERDDQFSLPRQPRSQSRRPAGRTASARARTCCSTPAAPRTRTPRTSTTSWRGSGTSTTTAPTTTLSGRLPAPRGRGRGQAKVCGGTCVPGHDYPIALRVTDSHGDSGVQATTLTFVADFDVLLGNEAKTIVPGASANFAVTVIGSKSFKTPVTLSAIDLPAGRHGELLKNPVTPTGASC